MVLSPLIINPTIQALMELSCNDVADSNIANRKLLYGRILAYHNLLILLRFLFVITSVILCS